jgi:hypothetical protein
LREKFRTDPVLRFRVERKPPPTMIDFMTGAMVRMENAFREPLAGINRKLRTKERAALAPALAGATAEAAEGS